jgi:protein ImuB
MATPGRRALGPESVVRGRLQGGRGPAQRFRLVPWTGPDETVPADFRDAPGAGRPLATGVSPWPGQIPAPAPAVVLHRPLPVQLVDSGAQTVGVAGSGAITATPARLSVAGGAWVEVERWAGPWPADERWWSVRGRRRQARIQVVTPTGAAHLLTCERGMWWLEATYD